MDEPTFKKISDDIVEISRPFREPFRLNTSSLHSAIENVKLNKPYYFTDEAYQKELNLYESALQFLQGDGEQP